MSDPLFSPSWYRVAQLQPRIRGHAHIHRHEYRGEIWYVLQDHAKGRYYRFTPAAYQLIGQMNGRRTVQELWEAAFERFGDDAPTQHEVIQLLAQLHGADVLISDVPPDTEELLRRSQRIERARRKAGVRSPLALRFPLFDPERFLSRTIGLVRPLFSVWGAALWLAVVGSGVVLAGLSWSGLTEGVIDRVLTAENLLILWLTYPAVKALHELGHAYAVKAWGGEVHEMGIMLLVLMPVPYVDASAASEFRSKRRRVIVDSAGILVELFLAALAMFVWVSVEPGTLRSVAYNVMLIGSVSTLLFNGNPLLRFDGYYILSDLIEIPNLAGRGLNYLGYLIKRYVFGVKDARAPYVGPGERAWLATYSIAAFVYRLFIYTAIILFIAGKFFVVGVLLAIWAAYSMVIAPLGKGLRFLVTSPVLREHRPRAIVLCFVVLNLVVLALLVLPFPSRTRSEGVVWIPEEALVRAGTPGFIERVVARPDAAVTAGDVLIECRDPLLEADAEVLRSRIDELQSRYDAAKAAGDHVEARLIEEEIGDARSTLDRAEERLTDLEIRSPVDGVFVVPHARDLPDRHLKQGELVAYVLDVEHPLLRVVVPQSKVDLVRRRTEAVQVRLAERFDEILQATIRREIPEAAASLPSTALGSTGGGEVVVDPFEIGGTTAVEPLFQFDVELTQPVDRVFIGGRAYVRFDHGYEPLAFQWYRSVRQLMLRRFNV